MDRVAAAMERKLLLPAGVPVCLVALAVLGRQISFIAPHSSPLSLRPGGFSGQAAAIFTHAGPMAGSGIAGRELCRFIVRRVIAGGRQVGTLRPEMTTRGSITLVARSWLPLLSTAVFVLAWTQSAALAPQQESGVLPIDPPTPYIHYFGATSPVGRVLVVHGLNAAKETSQIISAALADGGFEVYAIDLPGHGDSNTAFHTAVAQKAIRNATIHLDPQAVVAHSMGAGLLLDLAATEPFSTIVLLSPPPVAISEIHAERALIVTGEMDVPRIRSFAPIAADIGESKAEVWLIPWAAHSAPIFSPIYVRRIVDWLGGDGSKTRTTARLFWVVIMFVASLSLGMSLLRGQPVQPGARPATTILALYVVACCVALFTLTLINPFRWLRLFATDYLLGFLLLAGLVLAGVVFGDLRARLRLGASSAFGGLYIAFLSAAFVIAVPGMLAVSHLLHLSLPAGHWWRFPVIAMFGLPLFLADELMVRKLPTRWKPHAVALLTRGLLVVFMLTGVLTLNRESAFLLMLLPLVALFWMALWVTAGFVHRRTQNAVAAAVFAALVQGWVFASLFVSV